ncbi:Eco57I restriction-modification methylase domain-containing protein [Thalassotalea psychrophila]|uniref:site-specific DNA-methyltransferase (adenine-specific) n=1 Tax=Thalassotalea psychrophila TaxID=3065647 RepID=A0ABY9TUI4_9GAMM|nr:Eco57I restriction-modification methylase domain-containing protein [Colwelliaceae bacterium SQ149]
MSSAKVSNLLASFFTDLSGDIKVLDAGAGVGSLSAALVQRALNDFDSKKIDVTAFEIDEVLTTYLNSTYEFCRKMSHDHSVEFKAEVNSSNFIFDSVEIIKENSSPEIYDKAILNPPYLKVAAQSKERKDCKSIGIDSGNLYSLFVALAIKLLKPKGELVAITPRSFCNGPYFTAFRKFILQETAIKQIRVFKSRTSAFKGDEVLQENVVFHLVKSEVQKDVLITQSDSSDCGEVSEMIVPFEKVVYENDSNQFIHILTSQAEAKLSAKMSSLPCTLNDLSVNVSTGKSVDFRVRDFTYEATAKNRVPYIFPVHFDKGLIEWPLEDIKKPNAIEVTDKTEKLLVPNGHYVLTRRLSSKEEDRRVVAAIYRPNEVSSNLVAFDNKTNYFHANGEGLDANLAIGLYAFISSNVVDKYFRTFNGHTQVNATDLRFIRYPSKQSLMKIGTLLTEHDLSNFDKINKVVEQFI